MLSALSCLPVSWWDLVPTVTVAWTSLQFCSRVFSKTSAAKTEQCNPRYFLFEPCHENMVLSVLRKLIHQTPMHSHPVRPDVWFLVGPCVYFHTSCVWTAKDLVRLHGRAGSPEPSLVAYVISTIISWAGSFFLKFMIKFNVWRKPYQKKGKPMKRMTTCLSLLRDNKMKYLKSFWFTLKIFIQPSDHKN